MAYRVEFRETAARQMRKLDRSVAKVILDYLDDVAALEDPRARGKALVGDLAGLWRYRIRDYRAICQIQDDELVIVVLEMAHRSTVYG